MASVELVERVFVEAKIFPPAECRRVAQLDALLNKVENRIARERNTQKK